MNTPIEVKPLFIRRNQLKQITGLSQSTVWRLESEGKFPRRRRIGGGHCVGWLCSEVSEFLNRAEVIG